MKTRLPINNLSNKEEAIAFIKELHSNGELFHFDDNVFDIVGLDANDKERTRLNELTEQLFELLEDPFAIALELLELI